MEDESQSSGSNRSKLSTNSEGWIPGSEMGVPKKDVEVEYDVKALHQAEAHATE